jgi:hypothetical protein
MTSLAQICHRIRWGRRLRLGGHWNPMAGGRPIPRPCAAGQGERKPQMTPHARVAVGHKGRCQRVERGAGGRCTGCASGGEAEGRGKGGDGDGYG